MTVWHHWRRCPLEVKHRIVQLVGVFDLPALRKTSKELRELSKYEVNRRIFEAFRDFELDASLALQAFHEIGACVTGSTVLSIIDPGMVVPGDLDIYVPSRSANQLKRILKCTIHGLVHLKGEDLKAFGKRESGSYCTIPGLEKIWYFWVPKKGTLINVLVTSTE
ncbi:hypothetical protein BKA70DRAFT_1127952 [Coprinopsis sp. MPI-PUGE-AT-0042]|nr:hypothetical protein BKA70DRAFT_1127952 [Coprinopsis sp. MPI-PUGE-AT-0042]